MSSALFEEVVASYHRALQSGKLCDTFYDLFLSKSPEIPPMFASTDFLHQKLMLRQSLLEMLVFLQTQSGRAEIEQLAERHVRLSVKAEHYDLWLDALCEALAQHDPGFTPELEQKWRAALRPGIEIMISGLRSDRFGLPPFDDPQGVPRSCKMNASYTHIASLAREVEPPVGGIISRTLFTDERLKAVVFGFGAGQELSEHTATMPAIMHFVQGEATVTLGDDCIEASAETWIHMPSGMRHAIQARTPTIMLLLLLK